MSQKEAKADWIEDKCHPCNGTGQVIEMQTVKRYEKINPPKCPACGGTGREPKAKKSN